MCVGVMRGVAGEVAAVVVVGWAVVWVFIVPSNFCSDCSRGRSRRERGRDLYGNFLYVACAEKDRCCGKCVEVVCVCVAAHESTAASPV